MKNKIITLLLLLFGLEHIDFTCAGNNTDTHQRLEALLYKPKNYKPKKLEKRLNELGPEKALDQAEKEFEECTSERCEKGMTILISYIKKKKFSKTKS